MAAAADLATVEPVLAAAFEKANPTIKVRFVTGASAALAQQIEQGAPFDVFLSANIDLVEQLHLDGARMYTVGHVAALWRDGKPHDLNELTSAQVRFIALPNPKLAPYGAAAQEALRKLGLWEKVQPKVVYGENVRQTLQLFDSGNADVVLTAASLVIDRHPLMIPSRVLQKGGIVRASKEKRGAGEFLDWLVSAPAQQILGGFGFDKP